MSRCCGGIINSGSSVLESIGHAEGRVFYTNGSNPRYEYVLTDHLGNTRLLYTDLDNDGQIETPEEILWEGHYYPFGMEMKGPWMDQPTQETNYKYNGIEKEEHHGLNINIAAYRVLDPAVGQWCSVDPKAEVVSGLSPYQAMGNNPVANVDPEGDLFFVIPQISFNGGFSFGLEVGIGLPGILSASVLGGAGSGGSYWSIQGNAGGFYGGYGNNGVFAGFGYRWNGLSIGYEFGSSTISASYGYGESGMTTLGGSAGLNYNLKSKKIGYDVSGAYTHIFENPVKKYLATYSDKSASSTPIKQKTTHDCLIAACEYMGPKSYQDILKNFGNLYTPGKGTKTLAALKALYGQTNVDAYSELVPSRAKTTWGAGGKVLVAKNRNHAIVLNKIDIYKVTYKYRKTKIQTKFRYTYMDPAVGRINNTGLLRRFKYPTYYIK